MTTLTSTFTQPSELILGVARTGAKFTPLNHKLTGDRVFDAISAGDMIPVDYDEIAREYEALYDLDVRYIHEHARNPETREQTTDLDVYAEVARIARAHAPDALTSFGGSRNGQEVSQAIREQGELARIAQAGLAPRDGGADFVTTQAAIELQIVTDMERQGYIRVYPEEGTFEVLRDLSDYVPSGTIEEAKLAVHSTAGGANYGKSSAVVQMDTLKWTIDRRAALGRAYEVEWVQEARSSFLTWYMANAMPEGLRRVGRLNITLLFGFSERLRFPETYASFQRLVRKARAIANRAEAGDTRPLKVSVSVGAAVLPQHAAAHIRPLDVGAMAGKLMGPMERLAAYASQPDSGVDILRVGIEDTPYMLDPDGRLMPATNAAMALRAREVMAENGATPMLDPDRLATFATA
ncbi:MAG: 3-keto-5-aminohexanoate cleavage protein [Paracoccaceae bacterium]|nr:3-keto-5-aminohexanoate cleavage protein [Paracoccaceae bacterium]